MYIKLSALAMNSWYIARSRARSLRRGRGAHTRRKYLAFFVHGPPTMFAQLERADTTSLGALELVANRALSHCTGAGVTFVPGHRGVNASG